MNKELNERIEILELNERRLKGEVFERESPIIEHEKLFLSMIDEMIYEEKPDSDYIILYHAKQNTKLNSLTGKLTDDLKVAFRKNHKGQFSFDDIISEEYSIEELLELQESYNTFIYDDSQVNNNNENE